MIVSTTTNAQYNVAKPGSVPQRITGRMRRSMYDRFLSSVRPNSQDTILDVGATSDRVYDFSNYLEAWYPHKSKNYGGRHRRREVSARNFIRASPS